MCTAYLLLNCLACSLWVCGCGRPRYSFNQGSAHFLNLNTEMNSSTGSRQYEFVAADLAAVNRTLTPWVFVFGHRQMYSGNSIAPQNSMGDLEPLLMKYVHSLPNTCSVQVQTLQPHYSAKFDCRYKVDIAFWGHIHFAQQTCPMFQGHCVNQTDEAGYDAPIHVNLHVCNGCAVLTGDVGGMSSNYWQC